MEVSGPFVLPRRAVRGRTFDAKNTYERRERESLQWREREHCGQIQNTAAAALQRAGHSAISHVHKLARWGSRCAKMTSSESRGNIRIVYEEKNATVDAYKRLV